MNVEEQLVLEQIIVETPIKVRFYECDFYQHVNNTNYISYMDVGLGDYLKLYWPDLKKFHVAIHKVHIGIDFKNAATFDDELIVKTSIKAVGNTSITFFQEVVKADGTLLTQATSVFVTLDPRTGKKCPVPEQLLREIK